MHDVRFVIRIIGQVRKNNHCADIFIIREMLSSYKTDSLKHHLNIDTNVKNDLCIAYLGLKSRSIIYQGLASLIWISRYFRSKGSVEIDATSFVAFLLLEILTVDLQRNYGSKSRAHLRSASCIEVCFVLNRSIAVSCQIARGVEWGIEVCFVYSNEVCYLIDKKSVQDIKYQAKGFVTYITYNP